jgi:YjbE family integral membrane protein
MMQFFNDYGIQILQIVWIDLLLSGDNAVVIALACRSLPESQRKIGMILGAGTAIGLRIIFAMMITFLLAVPYLKLVGGILLLWIGVKLAMGEEEEAHTVESSENLWKAVRTIAIADAVMSLDNVVAIAAAAGGNIWLFVFGLLLSIPLIVFGSQLLTTLIDRYPLIVWAGAALLGWIAGAMIVDDSVILGWLKSINPAYAIMKAQSDGHGGSVMAEVPVGFIHYGAALAGAIFVVGLAWVLRQRGTKEA